MNRRKGFKGFTLIELMIVIAIIAIIAAIAIPGLLQSQRAANERNASASLKTVGTAEADFRSNDRDGNRVNDYWTLDVAGLHTVLPLGAAANTQNAIKLIEVSMAGAETFSKTTNVTFANSCSTVAVNSFIRPAPKGGYWYQALVNDRSSGAAILYAADTDGSTNLIHNNSIFGMSAYPDSMSSGRQVFVLNEGNTMFKRAVIANIKAAATTPPNAIMLVAGVSGGGTADPSDWPLDGNLQSFYGRMD